ncbi:uncharacterized protein F4822DRAFT_386596 [Hypoxylon trugodes]|uniref:uncharacterized protein n=1 Tax=Hypoxylon trugodes TaxID=326681 RepID=UPI0021A24996|nr:uncharacterized protein F4822DRAFT_386596 [Hypoxylon trugodes]KAI1393967.1 hypothetical protein F4822DRAFT_386596 [Hypoxylon trugodes]
MELLPLVSVRIYEYRDLPVSEFPLLLLLLFLFLFLRTCSQPWRRVAASSLRTSISVKDSGAHSGTKNKVSASKRT